MQALCASYLYTVTSVPVLLCRQALSQNRVECSATVCSPYLLISISAMRALCVVLAIRGRLLPQEVLMASRNSAYFHLLRSYFLTPAAALVAWTWTPLRWEDERKGNETANNDFVKESPWLNPNVHPNSKPRIPKKFIN